MPVQLRLVRQIFADDYTHGSLYVDGKFECYTIEDALCGNGDPATVGGWKVKGKSCIPFGTYPIGLHDSPRFGKFLPWLKNVPGFAYILIHSGNTSKDTEGCILVGQTRAQASIGNSRVAFVNLFPKIKGALDRGDSVTIEITRA